PLQVVEARTVAWPWSGADVVVLKPPHLSRDGGTGRRNGLTIRRPSGHGGSTPPPAPWRLAKTWNVPECVFSLHGTLTSLRLRYLVPNKTVIRYLQGGV